MIVSSADLAQRFLAWHYRHETNRRWSRPPLPEWFDHRSDLYRWMYEELGYWIERPVYSREVMRPGCKVLDLCCGDGFYAAHVFADVASHIDASDFDPAAIEHAKRVHTHPRVTHHLLDIRTDPFPDSCYDVIVWDGAIEHFTLDETREILRRCGNTILADSGAPLAHPDHEHEYRGADELERVLGEVFAHAGTIVIEHPARKNIYFRASDGRLSRF